MKGKFEIKLNFQQFKIKCQKKKKDFLIYLKKEQKKKALTSSK